MLLHSSTKITLQPIVRAGLTAAVTASVGHIPNSSRNTGFSFHRPVMKVWLNTGVLRLSLAIILSTP
jgi:hypothetical protein